MTRRRPAAMGRALGFVLLWVAAVGLHTPQAPAAPRRQGAAEGAHSSILVRWPGGGRVRRYRLQVSTDERFRDVVYDGVVEGRQQLVRGVAAGEYFWRVSPAEPETVSFSKAARVTVPAGARLVAVPLPADETRGWSAATGRVARLAAAKIRPGGVVDLVCLAEGGGVFAVDGASGALLWHARGRGGAAADFAPVVLRSPRGGARVLAAASGGVRLLRGDTGREVWRAGLEGAAASGAAADLDGDGVSELVVATTNPPGLHALTADAGRVLASVKLEAEVVGAPAPFDGGGARGVLLALGNKTLQARAADLSVSGEQRLDASLTTTPRFVGGAGAPAVFVGSEGGLVRLSFPGLNVSGLTAGDGTPALGAVAAADLNGDGQSEVVTVTEAGRVSLVGKDGVVRWAARGAGGGGAVAFADLDGDGVLDVVVPGAAEFALGFSGKDGTLLMRAGDAGARAGGVHKAGRPLVVAPSLSGEALLVGADASGSGLRAVGAPKGAARVAPARGDRATWGGVIWSNG